MDFDMAKNIIDEIDQMKIRGITLASRGEPLLYKNLKEILEYIGKKQNIIEIKLNTNAKLLNKSMAEMIINSPVNIFVVSTDHYIKDEYEKLRRGGNFNTFLENIKEFSRLRQLKDKNNELFTRASGKIHRRTG